MAAYTLTQSLKDSFIQEMSQAFSFFEQNSAKQTLTANESPEIQAQPSCQINMSASAREQSEDIEKIHIANRSHQPITVLACTENYSNRIELGHYLASLAIAQGAKSSLGITALSNAKSLLDVYQAIRMWNGIANTKKEIWNTFSHNNMVVNLNNYKTIDPNSDILPGNKSPNKKGKISLLIVNKKGHCTMITSGKSDSWIVTNEGVQASKEDHIWLPKNRNVRIWN